MHIVKYLRGPSTNQIIAETGGCAATDVTGSDADGSPLTTHWSSPETDFITAFTSSPTLRRLPPRPPRLLRCYRDGFVVLRADCLVIVTTVRRPAHGQCRRPDPSLSPTNDSWPSDRQLIHIFSTWSSSSTTCNPIIHEALTATRVATILSTRTEHLNLPQVVANMKKKWYK